MGARGPVRIGCWAGFWGDSPAAAEQLVRGAEIDYLVADHLAEITMALLARARAKDPSAGYIPDVVVALGPLLGEIHARGIRVVTNAGGLNPAACAAALRHAAEEAGVPLRVAHVEGDDLGGRVAELRETGAADMFTGEPVPEGVLTMNAYLGARPIADALGRGADIVVTGRCADSAVVLGPLVHEFGWGDDDHDLLSAGTLVGHIVECGPQSLGGLFTDWQDVPGWEDMGYPVAECLADGTAVITKPSGTGGIVTPATVAEQILYEIGDPGAYVMPDVVCDWRDVRLEQDGPDRVRVSGARGAAPTPTYKATTTCLDGFRVTATAVFAGGDATGRARRAGEAIVARAGRMITAAGHAPFTETSIEVLGAGDLAAPAAAPTSAREALVKIAVRHPDRDALQVVGREMMSLALVAQGMTGVTGGRPKPAPVIRLVHVLVDKATVPVTVTIDGEAHDVAVAPGAAAPPPAAPLAEGVPGAPDTDAVTVPLRRIAWARSGDKGNDANIGVIARRPELLPVIREQVTAARVAALFGPWLQGDVRRWELPGLHAINVLLGDVLGGRGGTSSLRLDPQGKSYGATLLDLEVQVPAGLLD
jgi:hypothetical protein